MRVRRIQVCSRWLWHVWQRNLWRQRSWKYQTNYSLNHLHWDIDSKLKVQLEFKKIEENSEDFKRIEGVPKNSRWFLSVFIWENLSFYIYHKSHPNYLVILENKKNIYLPAYMRAISLTADGNGISSTCTCWACRTASKYDNKSVLRRSYWISCSLSSAHFSWSSLA